jgi:hypothetical protein
MSTNEKKDNVDEKKPYSAPEIVRMGNALELTASGPGTVIDGALPTPTKPEHWKEVE